MSSRNRNTLKKRVRRAYDQRKLAQILTLPEYKFGKAFGMETIRVNTRRSKYHGWANDYYHFKDNGSRVLAVAHLDTVVDKAGRTPTFRDTPSGPYVRSGALDDRLGAYVILSLLPALGITYDWLLTVGEESGQSTAQYFDAPKDYDWVIEFDRGGMDVVMYQYEDADSMKRVREAGAKVGFGSFSDIAFIEHLGVKAFNWGVGYRGSYHTPKGYAFLNDTFSMVAKYLRFHEQNAGTRMPHWKDYSRYGTYDYDEKYDDSYYDSYYDCDDCGSKNTVDSVTWYCKFCGMCADCHSTDPKLAEEWGMADDIDLCQCYSPKQYPEEDTQAAAIKKWLEDTRPKQITAGPWKVVENDSAGGGTVAVTGDLADRPGG